MKVEIKNNIKLLIHIIESKELKKKYKNNESKAK